MYLYVRIYIYLYICYISCMYIIFRYVFFLFIHMLYIRVYICDCYLVLKIRLISFLYLPVFTSSNLLSSKI